MGWSIKKPLGNKPGKTIANIATGGMYGVGKGLLGSPQAPSFADPDYQGQYNSLAEQFGTDATALRGRLADNLTTTGNSLFQQANPYLLEDLNSRGLFTSSSAVNKAQADALAGIAADNNRVLSDYDVDVMNQKYNIKSGGMTAQQQYMMQNQDQEMAKYMGKRQSRDMIISSLLGAGGSALGGFLGR